MYAPIPIGHSTTLKEKYDAIKTVLQHIKYEHHQWVICVDLKMVKFLLEFSLLSMLLGQHGKSKSLGKKRLACSRTIKSWRQKWYLRSACTT